LVTENRKLEHLRICLSEDVRTRKLKTGFEDVHLIHNALPEVDKENLDTKTSIFGHPLSAPITIEAGTGGTLEALKINATLAEVAEEVGIGMGVGSQRAALEKPELEETFKIVRKKAPSAFLIANIGAPQLVRGYGLEEASKAVEMIEADALAIHLNPLQEAVQPEGETTYAGVKAKIAEIADSLNVPVIIKETGAGISGDVAKLLEEAGASCIDIAGGGGTSWAAVEYYRARKAGDNLRERLGETFWDWGIPTVVSLVEVAGTIRLPIIASGGLRTGLDVAKALSLGAEITGFGSVLLAEAARGKENLSRTVEFIIQELKNTMFLVGASKIEELKIKPIVITGPTREWLEIRGVKIEEYARRGRRQFAA